MITALLAAAAIQAAPGSTWNGPYRNVCKVQPDGTILTMVCTDAPPPLPCSATDGERHWDCSNENRAPSVQLTPDERFWSSTSSMAITIPPVQCEVRFATKDAKHPPLNFSLRTTDYKAATVRCAEPTPSNLPADVHWEDGSPLTVRERALVSGWMSSVERWP